MRLDDQWKIMSELETVGKIEKGRKAIEIMTD